MVFKYFGQLSEPYLPETWTKEWTNARGNKKQLSFVGDVKGGRHWWDRHKKFRADGWIDYPTDEDSWAFGVWINPHRLQILTFTEGDVILTTCPDTEHYDAEIAFMDAYYQGE